MENNEKINSKKKIINENTTVIDNNIIESPLFISSLKEVVEVEQLEKYIDKNRSIHRVIEVIKEDYEGTSNPKNYKNVPVVYRQWTDSKGLERQLLVTHAIPDMYTMDVWNALIGLYIQKISPIHFNNNKNTYDLDVNEMEFTLYELAKFMNKSTGGSTLDKLMKEIVRLNNAKYYSFANGVIFDKKKEKYLKSKTKGMSLILDCEFDSEKRVKDEKVNSKCKVEFNKLIIDNIRYQYIKYIDPKEYFALPSRGLTRRLYVYLKGNSHQSNGTKYTYIKRNFYVLKNNIPILEKQPSKIKERLKVPLKNLIKNGMITDYFYGDEDVINEQEPCIYFIFKGQKDEVINSLRKKYEEKQLQLEVAADNIKKDEFQMKIPENLDKTLEEIGFNAKVIKQLYAEYDKWEIIKYVIWLQQQQFKSKCTIQNPAGLLRFALMGNINLDLTNKDIVEFVENEQKKFIENKLSREEIVQNAYDKYVNEEMEKFKTEDNATHDIIYENTLINIEAQVDLQIAQLRLLEKNEGVEMPSLKLWEEFREKKDKSELFKKNFINSAKVLRGIMTLEEFKVEFGNDK
ncbi:replication initiator protein A [Clostridium botulinum]|uniref:Uncharacterized protein n=1 Tax=Clostridium botulinum TaxID=1491 RepID=A0A9Q1UY84_CLOBO|nr:replication initiator protein A [Clostridium botulinum]AEB77519.1 conserved hypothetical protein [Clostridium botulinum BKT015925]KEH96099.1 hypothetical protein Y848_p0095 [Clostridium botulinum C/D str. Sp77]KEH96998.1 hypothetical protein Z953_13445 [Clostridium botulinum D str. 16868]KLU74589.1 hypothetical protein CBC3_12875 [Clostridium botulinum V891]KOA75864.1 hypothetical protein ADU77_10430 [Clostridium botulinum]